jgi:hypothetical protein
MEQTTLAANSIHDNKFKEYLTLKDIVPQWFERLNTIINENGNDDIVYGLYSEINDYKRCIIGEAYGYDQSCLYLAKLLSPLQGLLTPITQIPMRVSLLLLVALLAPVVLPVWLLPEAVLGYDCAFVVFVDTGNENKPISITNNRNINMLL